MWVEWTSSDWKNFVNINYTIYQIFAKLKVHSFFKIIKYKQHMGMLMKILYWFFFFFRNKNDIDSLQNTFFIHQQFSKRKKKNSSISRWWRNLTVQFSETHVIKVLIIWHDFSRWLTWGIVSFVKDACHTALCEQSGFDKEMSQMKRWACCWASTLTWLFAGWQPKYCRKGLL